MLPSSLNQSGCSGRASVSSEYTMRMVYAYIYMETQPKFWQSVCQSMTGNHCVVALVLHVCSCLPPLLLIVSILDSCHRPKDQRPIGLNYECSLGLACCCFELWEGLLDQHKDKILLYFSVRFAGALAVPSNLMVQRRDGMSSCAIFSLQM